MWTEAIMQARITTPVSMNGIEFTLAVQAITGKAVAVNNFNGHRPNIVEIYDGNAEDIQCLNELGFTAEEYIPPPSKWWQFWKW